MHDEPSAELLAQVNDLLGAIGRLALAVEGLPGADGDLTLIAIEFNCCEAVNHLRKFLKKFQPPQPPAEPGSLAVTVVGPRIAENEISLVVARLKARLAAIAATFPAAELEAARGHLIMAAARRKDLPEWAYGNGGTKQGMVQLRLKGVSLLLVPYRSQQHLADLAATAEGWEEVQAAWHDYGLIHTWHFVAEAIWVSGYLTLSEGKGLEKAKAAFFEQAEEYFGMPETELSTLIDAYLPHSNPKAQNFSPAYRRALREFRRSHPAPTDK